MASLLKSGVDAGPEVGGSEAERLELRVHAAVGVMRGPPGLVLEPADSADPAVGAQVEPVASAARDANHVSSLDLNRDDIAVKRVDVEDAATGDDETDLVFVMSVLGAELCEQDIQVWSFRIDVDYVRRCVSAHHLQLFDLGSISAEYGICIGVDAHTVERPALVVDSDRSQSGSNIGLLAQREVLRRDADRRHS